MTRLTLYRFPDGKKAIVNEPTNPDTLVVFFHGAALEPTADLYLSFAQALPPHIRYVSPFLSASHFLAFQNDFRHPAGWSCHNVDAVNKEARSWISMMASEAENLVVAGHSWGGHLAATIAPERRLFLVSPIPNLRSIVETNLNSNVEPEAEWLRCREGAPLPFISRRTVASLSAARRQAVDTVANPQAPVCIVYGAKEHPLISEWVDTLPPNPLRTIQRLPGAGHFYSGRGELIADLLVDWLKSS